VVYRFNPPPNWPTPPFGWTPPPGWQPDPSWPPLPPAWQLWIEIPDQPPAVVYGPPPQTWVQQPQPTASQGTNSGAGASGIFGRRKQAEADAEKARSASALLNEQLAELQRQHAELGARAEALEAELNRVRGLDATSLAAEIEGARAELSRIREEARQERAAAALEASKFREDLALKITQATVDIERQIAAADQRRLAAVQNTGEAELRLAELNRGIAATDDVAMLQEVGIYNYRHPLADAVAYKARLADLADNIKTTARKGDAVKGATHWTVNGSVTEGRRMVADFSKLMLRAYNAEADYAVRSMRPHRLHSLIDRLDKSRETIARLGGTMDIRITDSYHRLRVRELELTADFLAKQDEEKERRRELREAQREEEKLQREIERERARLAKEREQYSGALARLRTSQSIDDAEAVAKLEGKLAEIDGQLAAVDAREANIRAGYVYVISNIGAFGERMVKIGLTRRLEPMERVNELGDASVPFRFDVHALIFSEDAVGLEHRLHKEFEARRVNRVNQRREFFYATPTEVRDVLTRLNDQHLLEFREEAEAPEWRASQPATATAKAEAPANQW
jgi:hypothetical protein